MKFTEEQYQKIVEIADEYQSNSAFGIIGDTTQKSIGTEFYETELSSEIVFYKNSNEIMAIVNPLTREWAHDKFVEKEKKYYWKLNGLYLIKDRFDGSIIFDSYKNLFTESEIKEWGYNPEMFDREEVK
ncbi:hypothetical protein [Leuconostoc mesenteroides]|uniref:hypothetical protein n=1 Tax=Leuconostoc mesenteroides TaxID=1245 RepID=UPI0023618103|nr:hypothetical protein [Leuconostoc mesenteroides]